MIYESFYLSDDKNVETLLEMTGLSLDELEENVPRFKSWQPWPGKLMGEVVVYEKKVVIRHHFLKNKKIYMEL